MALDSFLEVAALDRSSVPGDGARDRRAWQDTGLRVTLINDEDEGGEAMARDRMTCWGCCARRRLTQTSTPCARAPVLIQAVMKAEVTNQDRGQLWRAQLGADHLPRRRPGPALGYPRGRPWGCRSRRCWRAAPSPRCSNPADAASEPCSPSCSSPLWMASPPDDNAGCVQGKVHHAEDEHPAPCHRPVRLGPVVHKAIERHQRYMQEHVFAVCGGPAVWSKGQIEHRDRPNEPATPDRHPCGIRDDFQGVPAG